MDKERTVLIIFERNFDKLHKSLKLFDDQDKILHLKVENATEMGGYEKHRSFFETVTATSLTC